MRCLVTGAYGFIGSAIVAALKLNGVIVVVGPVAISSLRAAFIPTSNGSPATSTRTSKSRIGYPG